MLPNLIPHFKQKSSKDSRTPTISVKTEIKTTFLNDVHFITNCVNYC